MFKFGNVLACLNLKYLKKKELLKYPCLTATELSIFTQKIKQYKFFMTQYEFLSNLNNDQVILFLIQTSYILKNFY